MSNPNSFIRQIDRTNVSHANTLKGAQKHYKIRHDASGPRNLGQRFTGVSLDSGLRVFPDHSQLAMKAARRMAQSKQKVRTGRTVCRHLLMLLNGPIDVSQLERTGRTPIYPGATSSKSALISNRLAVNDKQFDLF